MSTRKPMCKNRQIPSKYYLQLGVVLTLICMFLIVSAPSAFAHSDSGGKNKSVSVAKKGKKHSSKSLQVFVKGGGKIVSSPRGLMCRSKSCTGRFPKGTKVVLKAIPASGKVFSGWRGVCGGKGKCAVRLNRHKNIQAVFSPPRMMRLVVKIKGEGKVRSYPPGLSCEKGFCKGRFPIKTKVVLEAIPASGKVFSGWRGVCGGKGKCAVRLNRHKNVQAVFSPPRLMRLVVRIKGEGKVQSDPPGLSCGKGYCMGRFPAGKVVKLIPNAGAEQSFSGWRGACRGVGACWVKLKRHKLVGAIFEPQGSPSMMSLEATIVGEGSITSQPSGLSCTNGTCLAEFAPEATVMLLATPKDGHRFSGWSGACAGTENCVVTMTTPNTVTAPMAVMATFIPIPPPPVALSVTIQGDGEGRVTSDPIGIDCPGVQCVQEFENGLEVTLLSVPKTGHMFTGWSGACTGTDSCVMTLTTPISLNTAHSVTATFTPIPLPPVALTVTVEGEGRVTSDPAGIDCPSVACTHDFENGRQVTLLPEPKAGHMFDGWSGDCAGNENCIVTLGSSNTVKAVFTLIPLPPVALSVTVTGGGQVTSTPVGIDCPSVACTHNFDNGQMVILVASANTGQTFSRWTGGCTGTGASCQVEMMSPMAVTAEFVSGNPGMTDQAAKRFLEQATWGPTPELMAHVKAAGKEAFLNEQFAMNVSTYPDPTATPASSSLTPARNQFFYNAFHLDDQLRQRVAFALGQLFVVSANTVGADYQMVPYLRLLHDGAFGNYEDLMRAVTLSPTMGRFLDMVNNDKTEPGSGLNPNENYPREFLQLFSVGTTLLNPDGSNQVDSNGNPIPPYDQDVILNMSRVMTGWTYPTKPGATPRWRNPSFYDGPMNPFDNHHDMEAKSLMNGFLLPAGQTAVEDLDQAIQHVFEHPNVGPFVATRLIRHLVTSNPSPKYIARVTQVFNANTNGVRGDLTSVLKAILLDTEAASVLPQGGHLREPVLFEIALLRALGATVDLTNPLYSRAREMGQSLFSPPSVFNYFSPLYRIPGSPLYGPEFQIHSFSNAMARANFVDRVVRSSLGTGATVDLSSLETFANSPTQLVSAVARMLLHELLRPQEFQSIIAAVSVSSTPSTRVRAAVYLVATSSRYQVQH
jgi:uncharacterized repeat protein (TIGR02543 family)